jgi:hypothetical protein
MDFATKLAQCMADELGRNAGVMAPIAERIEDSLIVAGWTMTPPRRVIEPGDEDHPAEQLARAGKPPRMAASMIGEGTVLHQDGRL